MNFKNCEKEILSFLRQYLAKSGAKGFVLGLSGGLDSAVVATLCAKIAPTHALIMPTRMSSKENLNDAKNLAKKLGLNSRILEISAILDAFCAANSLSKKDKMRYGNLCARARMCLLYDYSAANALLVVGTSNKSERMLGYGTIYGDMACALNPIAGLYKSDIFEFAKFLGVDEKIVNKAPSADLWENQSDESELGYSYKELDAALKMIESGEKYENSRILEFCKERMEKNSFKLKMPAIIGEK